MKINATEFAAIGTKLAKRAAKAEPAEKTELLNQLELLKEAAAKADAEGSEEIEIDIKKFDMSMFDAQAAARNNGTGGIASNIENLTKAKEAEREHLRKGLDTEGFPDDMNSKTFIKDEAVEKNFGVDSWLQK